ncbi:protein C3orf33 homolog [Sarcophilus harrisii]
MEEEEEEESEYWLPPDALEQPPEPSLDYLPMSNMLSRTVPSQRPIPPRSQLQSENQPSSRAGPSPENSPTSPTEALEGPGSSRIEMESLSPEPAEAGVVTDFNVVATLSQWADDNLCLIRNVSTGMAVVGLMLFARSIKLTTKFINASDIPVEFIKNNVRLRGRLRRITKMGLELEHIPITIPLISPWRRQPYGVLLVKIAGVDLTEDGHLWLKKEIKPFETLWFQLLARDNSSLLCYLLMNRGLYFNVSLNEEILRRGLGRTVLIKQLDHNSRIYWTVHKRLLRAELKAIRRGEGIWKEDTEKQNYIAKFKGSWREIWSRDNPFHRRILWELNKQKSQFQVLKSQYKKYKERLTNSNFMLKVREFLNHAKHGKKW